MGHHGWQGNPPRTEEEARRRIIEATTACIERAGLAKTSLSDVAVEAGVTRQTVYRYFPSLADILSAVALAGVEDFAQRMGEHLATFTTPADVAVESVVFAVRSIPGDPTMGLLVQAGETDLFTLGVTSPAAFALGARILHGVGVDWATIGVRSDDDFEGLAEILMRLFVSYLQYPEAPPRPDDDLRALLHRWLAPALSVERWA